jgi:3-oxoacyl-[acyl-carrier protein] reductase
MDLELTGMRALVTGGSGGIGLETAKLLSSEGAAVAVASRHPDVGIDGIVGVRADLSTADGALEAVSGAVSALGGLDILVNNVGWARISQFEAVDDEEWQTAWDTNVMSYVRCIRAAVPDLQQSPRPTIVNVASTSGKRPSTGMPAYSVTKSAVLSLSRLVADTYASDGIRCNAVCPGPTLTPAWLDIGGLADQTAADSDRSRDEVLKATGAARPIGRMAEPSEIAAVIAFLCSPRSAYVTGAAWSADGGSIAIII